MCGSSVCGTAPFLPRQCYAFAVPGLTSCVRQTCVVAVGDAWLSACLTVQRPPSSLAIRRCRRAPHAPGHPCLHWQCSAILHLRGRMRMCVGCSSGRRSRAATNARAVLVSSLLQPPGNPLAAAPAGPPQQPDTDRVLHLAVAQLGAASGVGVGQGRLRLWLWLHSLARALRRRATCFTGTRPVPAVLHPAAALLHAPPLTATLPVLLR